MTRKNWRRVSWPIVLGALAAPFMINCGSLPKVPGVPGVPGLPGNCPDTASVEAIEKFDFAGNFKLQADVAAKVKAGIGAAVEMKAIADKIDADLKVACGNLAHDLGATGDYKDGQEACKAAAKAIGDVKAKLGASAQIKLDVDPPKCGADIKAYADCAGNCDASLSGGKADVKCEGGKMQGTCDAKCTGDCEMSAGAACTGECSGTCDADIKGTCSGKCTGKCDGKAMDAKANGQCNGTCEGKCDAQIKGECKGKCGGSCHMSAAAECKGTCSGSCSVEMKAPKCTGNVEPPKMSAECKAKCDGQVQAKVECTPPHIALRIVGAADAKAEAQFKAAIEKDLGAIVQVAVGTGKQAVQLAGNIKTVVEGVQAAAQGVSDHMAQVALAACIAAPFKGALDAVASIQANVNVSVNVQASASASGSAKAG